MIADRLRLTRKLDGRKRLYIEGDIDEGEYRQQKTTVAAALAALPEDQGNPDEAVGRRLTGFLRDLAGAWQVATPAERNKIARQLFVDVIVENRTVVASLPRPELLPFFENVNWCVGGSDGDRSSVLEMFQPRRVVVPDLRPSLPPFIPRWTAKPRPGVVDSQRGHARARKLTLEQERAIRTLAGTKSLRSLAADFGVSHETIRVVLRVGDSPAVA